MLLTNGYLSNSWQLKMGAKEEVSKYLLLGMGVIKVNMLIFLHGQLDFNADTPF